MRLSALAALIVLMSPVVFSQSASAQSADAGAALPPQEKWKNLMYNMALTDAFMPVCQMMGYSADIQTFKASFGQKISYAPKYNISHEDGAAYIVEVMKDINPTANMLEAGMKSQDPAVATDAYRRAFKEFGSVCSDLAEFSNYLDPGPFQTSGQPQTYENFKAFRAASPAK